MKILKHPHKLLRLMCVPVACVSAQMRQRLDEMLALMYAHKGVGLAAPQVGTPLRILVMNATGKRSAKEDEHVFINPVISHRIGGMLAAPEACLSIPGEQGDVKRSRTVVFSAYKPDGTHVHTTFTGTTARVLQHEVDHLDGILFIDKLLEDA